MTYPRWIRVRQELDATRIADPYCAVCEQLQTRPVDFDFPADGKARIAITVGSRFIANLVPITT